MFRIVVFCAALSAACFAAEPELIAPAADPSIVRSVELRGSSLSTNLGTRPGGRYDAGLVTKDVRTLWSTGRFDDIRVEMAPDASGTSVVFDVVEKPRFVLHDFRVEPHSFGLQFNLPPGMPMDRTRAQQVARDLRKRLSEQGYTDAAVEPQLIPAGGDKVDLHLNVRASDAVRVKHIDFLGETALDPKELRRELHALHIRRILPPVPGIWQGWRSYPAYSPDAVESDLGRLRSFYLSRGYFDAQVRLDTMEVQGEDARVRIYFNPGPLYRVRQWEVSGRGLQSTLVRPEGQILRSRDLCSCLFAARRDAEKRGILDFNVLMSLNRVSDGPHPVADLAATVEEGRSYTVGKIDFIGRQRFSEAAVRRNMLLNESDLLNEDLLRKSVMRLNRTGYFDPLDVSNVQIVTDSATGVADLKVHVRERKRGLWSISGPVGPIRLAGPLQGTIASRLPSWGSGLLELSTYYASFSLFGYPAVLTKFIPLARHGILPILSLQRPFTPGDGWLSGFTIAPQLGWQSNLFAYATTQLGERLSPLLLGNSRLTPELSINFERPGGDGVLLCDPPKPRMAALRIGAATLLQFAASVPML